MPRDDAQLLMERCARSTLQAIAERHALSIEGARLVIGREGDRHIERLERDLQAATETGEHPAFVVPFQDQDGWQAALGYFQFCLDRLRRRGWQLKVETRQTPGGTIFFILTETEPA